MRVLDFEHLGLGDVELLAAEGDPRAVKAAGRFLLGLDASGPWKEEFARTLGRIGDPSAIPMLRAALARVDEPGFAPPPEGVVRLAGDDSLQRFTFTLMAALDLCGDSEILSDFERLAQQESPGAERAARHPRLATNVLAGDLGDNPASWWCLGPACSVADPVAPGRESPFRRYRLEAGRALYEPPTRQCVPNL
jgi:PBS lyase HEAT-like repeat